MEITQIEMFEVQRHLIESPTELEIRVIGAKSACNLNAQWHSRFPIIDWSNVVRNKYSICYLAENKGIPFAVAIWSSPVAANRLKDGEKLLELRRMAISDDSPKNTATWMLSKMRKDIESRFPEIIKLISYQDTEVHHGTIYKAANWIAAAKTKENFSWQKTRDRSEAQSTASKIRWELQLKKNGN